MLKKILYLTLLQKAGLAVVFLFLPVAITFFYSYTKNKKNLMEDVAKDLAVLTDAHRVIAENFLDVKKERAISFSTDGFIMENLEALLNGDKKRLKPLRDHLSKNKLPLDRAILAVSIISLDGKIVVSTDPSIEGSPVEDQSFVLNSIKAPRISAGAFGSVKGPSLLASAPVFSMSKDRPLGVIVNTLGVAGLEKALGAGFSAESGFEAEWKSMRAFIADRDRRIIAGPPPANGISEDRLEITDCLDKGMEAKGLKRTYFGPVTAGAASCIKDLRWAIVTEIDAKEVLEPARQILIQAIAGGIVVIGVVWVLYVIFSRHVVRRLRAVIAMSRDIATGNYGATVPVDSKDEIGELAGVFNEMAGDVRRNMEKLAEGEERLRAIIDNNFAVIYLKDAAGKYLLVNKRFETIFGLRGKDIAGKTDYDLFPEDAAYAFRSNDLRVLKEMRPIEFEEAVPQKDGTHHYIAIKFPLFDPKGASLSVCGISTDITDRKKAEDKLARINRLYAVLSSINEAIIRIRSTQRLYSEACRIAVESGGFLMSWIGMLDEDETTVSPVAEHGIDRTNLLRMQKCIAEANGGCMLLKDVIRQGSSRIWNDLLNDERMSACRREVEGFGFRSSAAFPIRFYGRAIGVVCFYSGEQGFFNKDEAALLDSLASDISFAIESIDAEAKAQKSRDDLELLESIAIAAAGAEDFASALKTVIEKVCDATGWVSGEVWLPGPDNRRLVYGTAWYSKGMGFDALIEASKNINFPPAEGLPGRVWESKRPEWIKDVTIDGSVFLRAPAAAEAGIKAAFGVPIVSGEKVLAVLVFFMSEPKKEDKDLVRFVEAVAAHLGTIARRKLAEEARLELKFKYEELANNLTTGIYRCSGGGVFLEANRAAIKMFDARTKEEFLKVSFFDLVEDRTKAEALRQRLLPHGSVKNEDIEMTTIKGRKIWASLTALGRAGAAGEAFFDGIIEDITDRKFLEEQLRQAQKLEAIGQLAGGVAHDFNNVLTAIIGYGNLLIMKKGNDALVRSYADHILALSEKAASLTQALLAFSRKQVMHQQPLDLNEIINGSVKILLRLIGENIELKINLFKDDLTIIADQVQIEQVLLNLVTNARDAMPKGGSITIETGVAELGGAFTRAHGYGESGKYAFISFADTGFGMDEEVKKRIFEPFFTTKEVGKGTGLGLSMVYGIVKQHGGFIECESAADKGTVFKIWLPLVSAEQEMIDIAIKSSLRGGAETILLAEDEVEVREITKAMLQEFGYRVIEASNGAEAVERFAKDPSIELLVLDVVMPGKSGPEAYEEIRKTRPGIKVVFMSGYASDTLKATAIKEAGQTLIQKPVAPGEFLRKIREVLDK